MAGRPPPSGAIRSPRGQGPYSRLGLVRGAGRHRYTGRLTGQKRATGADRRVSQARGHACGRQPAPSASPSPFHFISSMYSLLLFSHEIMSDSFEIPWTVAQQAPLSMRLPKQKDWIRLPFPSPGNLFNPGIKPEPLALPLGHQGSPPV